MKTNKLFFFLLIAAFAFFVIGCESDDDKEINEFNVLSSYIEDNGLDWANDMTSWIKNLGDINTADYFVLDIRGADDFNTEHIAGAVNASLGTMFDVVGKANADKVLVVCYSGQTSAYAHMLLRLKGIEAYSLKWGMSIFSQDHDKWTGNCSNQYADHANWVDDAPANLPTYDYPTLNTGEENGEDILDEQIQHAIDSWSSILVAGGDVIANPDAYAIYNYWAQTDYDYYGHIKDAYQLDPKTLTTDANLAALNPNETNVIYCWTGQTSAAINAYLTVLGYTTKSLKFGVNSMIYDVLEGHKWSKPYGG